PRLNGKRLELLNEAVPRLTRVAYLRNPANPVSKDDVVDIRAASRALRLELLVSEAQSVGDLDDAFGQAARRGAGASSSCRTSFYIRFDNALLSWRPGIGCPQSTR